MEDCLSTAEELALTIDRLIANQGIKHHPADLCEAFLILALEEADLSWDAGEEAGKRVEAREELADVLLDYWMELMKEARRLQSESKAITQQAV